MNWYREYHAEWKEIIETVARELGKSEQMVEIAIVAESDVFVYKK